MSGEYKPGEILPPRTFFVEKFDTTLITVQRAFNFLIDNGFVTAKSRSGTYVAERPVNLFRYALVFSRSPSHGNWTRFWQLMLDSKKQLEKELDIDIDIFQGLDYGESCRDFHRFIRDCRSGSLAGAIFTGELHNFPKETYHQIDIPATCISRFEIEENISKITLDTENFYHLCAKKLSELGCTKVGIISADFFEKEKEEMLQKSFAAFGIPYNKSYIQGVSVRERFWARRFVNLLMEYVEGEKKFDALLVLDDNLLPEVVKGVHDEGLVIGQDIEVVSHENLPAEQSLFPNVHFVGYKIESIIKRGIEQLKLSGAKSEIYIKAEFHS